MRKKLKININQKPAVLGEVVPSSLEDGLFKYTEAKKWFVESDDADLMVQKVLKSGFGFWKIDMLVKTAVVVNFDFGTEKKLVVFNIGQEIRIQFRPKEVWVFRHLNHQEVCLDRFGMSLFAGFSKDKYELVLVEVANVDRVKAENMMLKTLFNFD